MYAGTILNYIDNSKIDTEADIALDTRSPLWMMASAFDKGPEKLTIVDVNNFYRLYGDTLNFDKYGQLNLQAANILNAGGRIWVKRLVADDATYGNLYFTAEIGVDVTKTSFVTVVKEEAKDEVTKDVECIRSESETEPGTYVYTRVDNGMVVTPKEGTIPSQKTETTWTVTIVTEPKKDEVLEDVLCYVTEKETEPGTYVTVYTRVDNGTVVTPKEGTTPSEPVVEEKVKLIWKKHAEPNIKSYDQLQDAISIYNVAGSQKFVPFSFIDNGRGGSVIKNVRFVPDYNVSRNLNTVFYNFEVFEGSRRVEYNTVTADPDVMVNNRSYRLYKDDYTQIDVYAYDAGYDGIVKLVMDALNQGKEATDPDYVSEETVRSWDLMFGYDNRGAALTKISVECDGFAFNTTYGIPFEKGSDGAFKDIKYVQDDGSYKYDDALVAKMVDFYKGRIDEKIYDVDNYRLYGIADANLPFELKQAITEYVVFRNDCFFFRDLGIDDTWTYADIISASQRLKDEFTDEKVAFTQTFMYADYFSTYEILDPETRYRERVTMMYDMVSCLTRAYINSPFSPTAGTYNGFTLASAIPDTLNYTPLKIPGNNYKQSIDDARLNYASYQDNGALVVQSLYTKNKIYSQLSYISNVLSMQEVGRRVAMVCPEVRFSLQLTGNDVSNYTKRINAVLENYAGFFDTLELVYTADTLHISQKIFYAAIQFSFANWYQTEIFDLIANPTVVLATSNQQQ